MRENLTIGFIGNPNCGKTTLFNAYTGANLKVANWPGVTVEKVEGAIKDHDLNIRLVDLPGTYSLTSYTMEEQVSRQFILSDEVDVIIDVADASALERNLYLTLQLLELGKPVVLALNMMDIVEKRGIPNINSGAGMDTLVGILGAAGFGQLNAFCLMIFCLLYVPCAAALATIRKESGSTRWMLFSALFQLVVAWAVTFVVYRVGLLL